MEFVNFKDPSSASTVEAEEHIFGFTAVKTKLCFKQEKTDPGFITTDITGTAMNEAKQEDSSDEKSKCMGYILSATFGDPIVIAPIKMVDAPSQMNDADTLQIIDPAHHNQLEPEVDIVPDSSAANGSFKCSVCPKLFSHSVYLIEHMRSHTRHVVNASENSPHACEKLPAHSNKPHQPMRGHVSTRSMLSKSLSHTGEKPFKCSMCLTSLSKSNQKKRRMRTHTGEQPFKCSKCSTSFSKSIQMKKHMRTHKGEKPFKCSMCSECFSKSNQMKRHMRTHAGDKPFKCSICSKCFANAYQVKRHMRTHTGEKPFQCSVCSRRFAQSNYVKQHMLTHTGEKPFQCSVCSKRFVTSTDLKRHMLIHTGVKTFACSLCPKLFAQPDGLRVHMSVHGLDNAFKCIACSKTFKYSYHLKRHMLSHTGELCIVR